MSGRWLLAGLVMAVALPAGCGTPVSEREPFTDGRACQAVEFDAVEAALGVRFETATAARVQESSSCVLAIPGQSFPDLTVVISPSTADEVIFRASIWPAGATTVEGLGRSAYQLTLPPVTGQDGAPSGPGLRIGWLSAAPQLMMLRYTWEAEATPDEIAALTPRIVELAMGIEQAIVAGPAR